MLEFVRYTNFVIIIIIITPLQFGVKVAENIILFFAKHVSIKDLGKIQTGLLSTGALNTGWMVGRESCNQLTFSFSTVWMKFSAFSCYLPKHCKPVTYLSPVQPLSVYYWYSFIHSFIDLKCCEWSETFVAELAFPWCFLTYLPGFPGMITFVSLTIYV